MKQISSAATRARLKQAHAEPPPASARPRDRALPDPASPSCGAANRLCTKRYSRSQRRGRPSKLRRRREAPPPTAFPPFPPAPPLRGSRPPARRHHAPPQPPQPRLRGFLGGTATDRAASIGPARSRGGSQKKSLYFLPAPRLARARRAGWNPLEQRKNGFVCLTGCVRRRIKAPPP